MNYELQIKRTKNAGYTIIETMIAVSLFVVVVTAGLGALLNANLLHHKSQDMRSVMDNLSFMVEDMGRNLRTGYNFRCFTGAFTTVNINTPQSCASGGAVAFKNSSDNSVWVYKIESVSGGNFNVSKSVDGGASWVQLNPTEVVINSISGFSVLGAEPPGGGVNDRQQPMVNIRLVGKILLKNNIESPFSLQTSVSQRLIDL